MKIKSIKNKAKKMGYKIAGNKIFNNNKVMKIMHNHNSDEAFSIHIKKVDDVIDCRSDYFPGSFHHTIKSAFEAIA